ncbi:MAG: PEP-CTERM sorting domain-containing protein [Myxococcales bacterium]|nr:PEP-CTERM sorting domain-containing protein [Myxococcales bacterium]
MLAAWPAAALTISNVAISAGGGNTANATNFSNAIASSTQVLDSGGTVADAVSASENARVRYAANHWTDSSFGLIQIDVDHEFDVSFRITANPGTTYDVAIDSLFSGVVQTIDDSFSGYASGFVGPVSVQMNLNGAGAAAAPEFDAAGAMIALGYYGGCGSSSSDSCPAAFSQTGTKTLTGLEGTTDLSFSVVFASRDYSWSDEAGLLLGLDEAGGATGLVTASQYDALPTARDASGDGHFLGISATVTSVIPEPSTLLLLGMGLVGVALRGRHS